MSNKSIIISNLTKAFQKGAKPKQSLREYFLRPFSRDKKKEFKAIDSLSFEVNQGEFFGIIGRNGSGKSTLLKLLAGIISPSSGKIQIAGKIVPFLELGVGFNPELTARENVYLNGTILGMRRKELDLKFDEIIEFAEVGEFVDTQVKNFSSGMYVRLAFAIAIQAEADVYLIDEILSVGDYAFQQKCFNLFRELKKQGKTIIFVSHDLGSVREFCDRVMYIKFGKLIKIGNTIDVVEDYIVNDRRDNRNTKKGGDLELQILDMDGREVSSVSNNSAFKVRIDYKLSEEALKDDLVIGFAIHKDADLHIFGTNSEIEKKDIKFKREGSVEFAVEDFPFLHGHYDFSAAIHNKKAENYVWKNRAAKLAVIRNHQHDGLVNLDVELKDI